jgi:hypothetical protein
MSQPGDGSPQRRSRLPWLVAGGSAVVAVAAVVTLVVVLNNGDSGSDNGAGSSAGRNGSNGGSSSTGGNGGGSSSAGSTGGSGSSSSSTGGASAQADTRTPGGVAQAAANALNDDDSNQLVTLACPAGKDWVTAKITRIAAKAGQDSFQATVKQGDLLVVGDYYAEVKIELTYAGMPTDTDDDDDDDGSDNIGLKMGKENGEWCIAWLDD